MIRTGDRSSVEARVVRPDGTGLVRAGHGPREVVDEAHLSDGLRRSASALASEKCALLWIVHQHHALWLVLQQAAQGGETGGYRWRHRYGDPEEGKSGQESSSGWNDLIGWIEEQSEDDAQGFAVKRY